MPNNLFSSGILVIVVGSGLISCQTESVNPYNLNRAPVIESLMVTPDDSIEIGRELTVICRARDDEGDSLRYNWTSNGGRFLGAVNENQTQARWSSSEVGCWTITVGVSDRWHTTSRSLMVWALPQGEVNQPPVIESLTLDPPRVPPGDTVLAVCQASDAETPSADLIVHWRADKGRFIEDNLFTILWIAPQELGQVHLAVEVSDGRHTTMDSALAMVALAPVVLYENDFSTDNVSSAWSYAGMLSSLGALDGPHSIGWDSTAKALRVEGRSDFGAFAFKLNSGRFNDAIFSIKMRATDRQFGCAGFIPVFVDTKNYVLIALGYYQQAFRILIRQNDAWLLYNDIWKDPREEPYRENRDYRLIYESRQGTAIVKLDDRELWRGAAPDFGRDATLGVVVSGLNDSGALLFDDLRVVRE